MQNTLIDACKDIRQAMLQIEGLIIHLKVHPELRADEPAKEGVNYGEAVANIMLAYRHAEDARMRLGKVIQAMDGGTSVYDKPKE